MRVASAEKLTSIAKFAVRRINRTAGREIQDNIRLVAKIAGDTSPDIEWVDYTLSRLRDNGQDYEYSHNAQGGVAAQDYLGVDREYYHPVDRGFEAELARRLAAIREFSDLGAGFRIAALDLELRGAGNLLGGQQSGHIQAVGLDLYVKLLEETILELKGEPSREAPRAVLNLGLEMRIPAAYVPEWGATCTVSVFPMEVTQVLPEHEHGEFHAAILGVKAGGEFMLGFGQVEGQAMALGDAGNVRFSELLEQIAR